MQGEEGGGGEGVPVGMYLFAPLRCTSAHHKLHMYTATRPLLMINAQSVVDFGCVSKKEPVLLY